MAQQNLKTIQDLKLEIQELRQALTVVIAHLNNINSLSDGVSDPLLEKMQSHAPVEVNEDAMDCCEGGPQWGHARSCQFEM